MRRVCVVSHRLGGFDGVSIEAGKWIAGFRALGCQVTRAAGFFADHEPADVVVRGLWADRPGGEPPPVDHSTIRGLCQSHDLLVLDNAGSLWSAPEASVAWERHALETGVHTIVRHHDPPWQGVALRPVRGDEVPLHHPDHLHVLINRHTEREFASRWPGLRLRVVHNRVDVDALAGGERDQTREWLGVGPSDLVAVHPARVEGASKNIPGAVRFARALAELVDRPVRYWLTDDAPTPAVAGAPGLVRGRVARQSDMYAAADLVLLPSTWEGWGLPVTEAAAARKPVVAGPYPVLDEIRSLGVTVFEPDQVSRVVAALADPAAVLDANQAAVRARLDLRELPGVLADLVKELTGRLVRELG